MKRLILLTTILAAGTFFTSNAQTLASKSNTKQTTQRLRIAEGKKSGELTRKEAAILNAQQRNIKKTKRRAKADGVITARERKAINKKQRIASRSICRQKNDGQSRN